MRLGDLLVVHGIVTRQTVAAALALQRKNGKRLGQQLIAMGALTSEQLLQALEQQRQLEDAISACARTLKDLRLRHGNLHRATNQACFELASANLAAGYTSDALALGEHVFSQYRSAFGPDHESTLEAAEFVATVRKTIESTGKALSAA